jgi:hypothetical protein
MLEPIHAKSMITKLRSVPKTPALAYASGLANNRRQAMFIPPTAIRRNDYLEVMARNGINVSEQQFDS